MDQIYSKNQYHKRARLSKHKMEKEKMSWKKREKKLRRKKYQKIKRGKGRKKYLVYMYNRNLSLKETAHSTQVKE